MSSFALHHIGLSCTDPIALERWSAKHFGFRRARVYPGPPEQVVSQQVVMLKAGDTYLELFPSTEPLPGPKVGGAGQDYSGFRHLAFRVDDLDAKLAEMGEEAPLTLGPVDMSQFIEGMQVAWVSDPEGNIVELNQGYVDEQDPPAL